MSVGYRHLLTKCSLANIVSTQGLCVTGSRGVYNCITEGVYAMIEYEIEKMDVAALLR